VLEATELALNRVWSSCGKSEPVTSPWSRGKCARFGAGRSGVRGLGKTLSGRVLTRPCKLALQPSYQVHGMRKSCREPTQNTKSNGEKWKQKLHKFSRGATRP